VLALRARTTVGREELIEALWGEEPPSSAPKLLQVQVSHVRRVLADAGQPGRITTRPYGYELTLGEDELDVTRAQALVARAHAALASGAADGDAQAALALWRGQPLSDVADASLARQERARLEELRLEACELAIEADLVAGRPQSALSMLEPLLSRHPLRERLHGLRMLALYRAGRQADALQAFRDARGILVEEIGIEPGPELRSLQDAILRQDPALGGNGRPVAGERTPRDHRPRSRPRPARRARRGRLAAGAIAVALAATAAMWALLGSHGERAAQPLLADSIAVVDPGRGRVVDDVALPGAPDALLAHAGRVWAAAPGQVWSVDLRARRAAGNVATGEANGGLAFAAGSLWVADRAHATLERLDPTFGALSGRVRIGEPPDSTYQPAPGASALAAGAGALWVARADGSVARIDPRGRRVTARIRIGEQPSGIAIGAGAVWVTDAVAGTLVRVDPQTLAVLAVLRVGASADAVAVGAGAVWVAVAAEDRLVRVDPGTNAVVAAIAVGAAPRALAMSSDGVWVADSGDGTVVRIDPASDRVVRRITVGQSPQALAVAQGRLWVAVGASIAPRGAAAGIVRVVATGDISTTDPALDVTEDELAWQLDYATCAKLLDYPDRSGGAGTRLTPELAAALPVVSDHGRTWTFRLRSGFRFAPPSGAPLTAADIRATIERVLSPRTNSYAADFVPDLVGEQAFRAGRTAHLSGVSARGPLLRIRTVRPAPDLPARLAAPYFCMTPAQTPVRRGGVEMIPTAGPYYVARYEPHRLLVLRRNPGYRGPRPRRAREIDVRLGVPPATAARQVRDGRADVATGLTPQSDPGTRGGLRTLVQPIPGLRLLWINPDRRALRNTRLRRALSLALDRAALAPLSGPVPNAANHGPAGLPTDQLIPPQFPGHRDVRAAPLRGPDLPEARRLAGHGRHRLVLWTCNIAPCPRRAAIIAADLRAIGVHVTVHRLPGPVLARRAGNPGNYDLTTSGWVADYADPSEFTNLLLRQNPRMRAWPPLLRAARSFGRRRLAAYARLDAELSRTLLPIIPYAVDAERDLLGPRAACPTSQPLYGLDLPALCPRQQP
jgi:YVTN family beta-propeller protein